MQSQFFARQILLPFLPAKRFHAGTRAPSITQKMHLNSIHLARGELRAEKENESRLVGAFLPLSLSLSVQPRALIAGMISFLRIVKIFRVNHRSKPHRHCFPRRYTLYVFVAKTATLRLASCIISCERISTAISSSYRREETERRSCKSPAKEYSKLNFFPLFGIIGQHCRGKPEERTSTGRLI